MPSTLDDANTYDSTLSTLDQTRTRMSKQHHCPGLIYHEYRDRLRDASAVSNHRGTAGQRLQSAALWPRSFHQPSIAPGNANSASRDLTVRANGVLDVQGKHRRDKLTNCGGEVGCILFECDV